MNILDNKKHLHFIGIGGSGMYPIVQILHAKGFFITGSDNNQTDTISAIRDMGITVFMTQQPSNIEGADLIIFSAAIMADNPELVAAKNSGVMLLERAQMLGFITEEFQNVVCISGTHGKTTTSAMLTQILLSAQKNPTAVIGGKLPSIGGNGCVGDSQNMVCEACEFVDTFLKLHPDIAVILNIDIDHMDYFKTLDNLIASFNKFARLASNMIIVNGDDPNTLKAVSNIDKKIVTFGLGEDNDFSARNIVSKINDDKQFVTTFDIYHQKNFLTNLSIFVPGMHNVLNALAAVVAALESGVDKSQIQAGFDLFRGANRRFEVIGKREGITVVDDYAHHPLEIKVTLEAAMKMNYNTVWAVHQPFTFSRTAMLLDDFADVLSIADKVVLAPIMGSREVNTYNIYSSDLQAKLNPDKPSFCLNSFEEIVEFLLLNAKSGDLILTLGCGDVNKIAKMFINA